MSLSYFALYTGNCLWKVLIFDFESQIPLSQRGTSIWGRHVYDVSNFRAKGNLEWVGLQLLQVIDEQFMGLVC